MARSTLCLRQRVRRVPGEDGDVRGDGRPQLAEDPFEDRLVAEVHPAVGARDPDSQSLALSLSMSTSQRVSSDGQESSMPSSAAAAPETLREAPDDSGRLSA